MVVQLALHLARADPDDLRTGCLTPALALGVAGAVALDSDDLHVR